MNTKTELTIEFVHNNFWLCKRGVYDRSSVLAGQEYRQLITPYDSLAQAQAANPEVKTSDEGAPEQIELSRCAPSWFDESAAGERWDEDY